MKRVIERILNLLAFLLTAGRPVTADEIRYTVAGYDQESDAAFRRTFERDKDLLRSLGVPLEMTATDVWEVEQGYVIPADEYAIRDPGLTDEERTALMMAAQVVQFGGQPTELGAIFKLGGAPPAAVPLAVTADLGGGVDDLGVLFDAVATRRKVRFSYSGRMRTVRPYTLALRIGHWYLAAPEEGQPDTVKVFRVDRMSALTAVGDVGTFTKPEAFDPRAVIPASHTAAGDSDAFAEIWFDHAVAGIARTHVPGIAVAGSDVDGVVFSVPIRNRSALIGWVLGFDDRAEIVAPEDLRADLISHIGVSE
ncbi:MAG: WYL domain-containing protein [Acidimicrobiia bacterium]|nr:WYL domain-containing protein [Acidimicrobiia bacterium]